MPLKLKLERERRGGEALSLNSQGRVQSICIGVPHTLWRRLTHSLTDCYGVESINHWGTRFIIIGGGGGGEGGGGAELSRTGLGKRFQICVDSTGQDWVKDLRLDRTG